MPMSFDASVRGIFSSVSAMPLFKHLRLIAPCLVLLICLIAPTPGWTGTYTPAEVPNPKTIDNSYVSNPDGILGAGTVAALNATLAQLERDTGAQVAVVAIDDTDPHDIFSFAQALFEHWGIGDKDRDDGLLVLLVRDQRTIRLHTGYGLEGTLPDAVCKRIQEDFMVPEFKRGDYDAGLVAGVAQVKQLLTQPAYAEQFVSAPSSADREAAVFQRVFSLASIGFFGLMGFTAKSLSGYFSGARRITATPPAMRYTRVQWGLMMIVGPVLIVLLVEQLGLGSPVIGLLALLYGYFIALGFVQLWRQRRHAARLYTRHNYTAITRFLTRQRGFWRWMAFLFPLPFALYPFVLGRRIHAFRTHPRQCPKCRQPMQLQSEESEDAYLSKGRQVEEDIHAMEHDVWHCAACGHTTVTSFEGKDDDDYEKCPKCDYHTFWEESDETTRQPSYDRQGAGKKVKLCKHCGHRKTIPYTIPRLTRSSSSSSGGGSSSSGSFGGGSSGGGGSSSSW